MAPASSAAHLRQPASYACQQEPKISTSQARHRTCTAVALTGAPACEQQVSMEREDQRCQSRARSGRNPLESCCAAVEPQPWACSACTEPQSESVISGFAGPVRSHKSCTASKIPTAVEVPSPDQGSHSTWCSSQTQQAPAASEYLPPKRTKPRRHPLHKQRVAIILTRSRQVVATPMFKPTSAAVHSCAARQWRVCLQLGSGLCADQL